LTSPKLCGYEKREELRWSSAASYAVSSSGLIEREQPVRLPTSNTGLRIRAAPSASDKPSVLHMCHSGTIRRPTLRAAPDANRGTVDESYTPASAVRAGERLTVGRVSRLSIEAKENEIWTLIAP
jgi:hypothetical protein